LRKAYLYRLRNTDEGTFGILAIDGKYWHSLELPNRDNKQNVSCIPVGDYKVSIRHSPHFGRDLYHVREVPHRGYILIHGANLAGDTSLGWQTHLKGCITLGKKIGRMKNKFGNSQRCVFSSRQAIMEMMDYLGNEEFKLEIKDII